MRCVSGGIGSRGCCSASAGLLSLLLCAGKLDGRTRAAVEFSARPVSASGHSRTVERNPGRRAGAFCFTAVGRLEGGYEFAVVLRPPRVGGMASRSGPCFSLQARCCSAGLQSNPRAAAIVLSYRAAAARLRLFPSRFRVLMVAAISILLAVPLLLNWYEPAWNGCSSRCPISETAAACFAFSAAIFRSRLWLPVSLSTGCCRASPRRAR